MCIRDSWHSALEMKLYLRRFVHHIGGLPDFSALKFTRYNQYESLILPLKRYLEEAGVEFRFGVAVTNVEFDIREGKKTVSYTHLTCKAKLQPPFSPEPSQLKPPKINKYVPLNYAACGPENVSRPACLII